MGCTVGAHLSMPHISAIPRPANLLGLSTMQIGTIRHHPSSKPRDAEIREDKD